MLYSTSSPKKGAGSRLFWGSGGFRCCASAVAPGRGTVEQKQISVLCWDFGLGPHLHVETEGIRNLKGFSLPSPQQFLLTKDLPQRGCWGEQGGARSRAPEKVSSHYVS